LIPNADPILDALTATLPVGWSGDQLYIGANWTIAILTDPSGRRRAGLAATPGPKEFRAQVEFTQGAAAISEPDAASLASNVYSPNPVAAAVGFASLNAFLQPPAHLIEDIDAADWLAAQGRNRRVALVGRFPFIDELRPVARQLWVLELDPRPGEFPAKEAVTIIPQAEIVAITGSTLVNHTLSGLLALAQPVTKVMLLGPTTPLSPLLFDFGIDLLSGVQVVDIEAALFGVAEGLTFRHMKGLRRVTLRKPG
jgi:uncharacterized protein